MVKFDSVEDAIADLRSGKAIIVMDNEGRENESDLVFAGEKATPELMAFTIRHTAGFICVCVEEKRLKQLEIPLMFENNTDPNGTQYTVTVDAKYNVSTGISAHDRAMTVKSLADYSIIDPGAFTKPGHMVPLKPHSDGLKSRTGHTEAVYTICKLAGFNPVGVLSELINEDGTMMRKEDTFKFAKEYNLKFISIDDLV
ncbi:hypothetical protein BB560_007223, partial [Smittium megazygosporum]